MKNLNQKGIAPVLILVAVIGIVGFLLVASSAPFKTNLLTAIYPKDESHAATFDANTKTFLETFDGAPATPTVFKSPNWDISWAKNGDFGNNDELIVGHQPNQHGPNCEPPIKNQAIPFNFTTNPLVTHLSSDPALGADRDEDVFICKDHLMTSTPVNLYLTPAAMVDFSQQEATIRWDMSTFTSSTRDWIDVWITPYNDQLTHPIQDWLPFFNGEPRNAVQMQMGDSSFGMQLDFKVLRNSVQTDYPPNPWDATGFDNHIPVQSPARRDTFEIAISRNHLKVCIVSLNYSAANPGPNGETTPKTINACSDYPNIADLGWDKGIVQFGHIAYAPGKGCKNGITDDEAGNYCQNTWHWDNVKIQPAIPFTIIHSDKRFTFTGNENIPVKFDSPAPANSHLRFTGVIGSGGAQFSVDNGQTWIEAHRQPTADADPDFGGAFAFFTPIPQGTTSVLFRGNSDGICCGRTWLVQDVSIFSTTQPVPGSSTTPSVAPSPTPASSPSPTASVKVGDVDGNGKVDIFDYNIVLGNFGKNGTNIQGDLDKNGKVDIFDFNVLLTNFGK